MAIILFFPRASVHIESPVKEFPNGRAKVIKFLKCLVNLYFSGAAISTGSVISSFTNETSGPALSQDEYLSLMLNEDVLDDRNGSTLTSLTLSTAFNVIARIAESFGIHCFVHIPSPTSVFTVIFWLLRFMV